MRAKTFVSLLGTFESTRGFPIWLADARSENRLADHRLAACTTWRRCSGLSSIEAWPSRSSCRASREALHRSAGGLLSGTSAAAKAIVSILNARLRAGALLAQRECLSSEAYVWRQP